MTIEDNYLERSQSHIGIVDMVILAAVAGFGYLVSSQIGEPALASPVHAADKNMQQICTVEELRQIRSGPETCYVPINADKHEFSLEPVTMDGGNALRNAGRQNSSR
ncbi:hypothetical protein [Dongia sp.]|uniref:hypothetical protein n=1 Tax=Dongia sp. TaxID=1977262 RepID=UPI0035B222B0